MQKGQQCKIEELHQGDVFQLAGDGAMYMVDAVKDEGITFFWQLSGTWYQSVATLQPGVAVIYVDSRGAKPNRLNFLKRVFSISEKTEDQIKNILQAEADRLKPLHPDYEFHNLTVSPIDRFGGADYTLVFILKEGGQNES